jgi:tyrosyl-tRNA synthetase
LKSFFGCITCGCFLQNKLVDSKTEFRRLIDEGAISFVESGEKITDPNYKLEKDSNFKIGKRRFIKIKV